jgi:hypothetical protein
VSAAARPSAARAPADARYGGRDLSNASPCEQPRRPGSLDFRLLDTLFCYLTAPRSCQNRPAGCRDHPGSSSIAAGGCETSRDVIRTGAEGCLHAARALSVGLLCLLRLLRLLGGCTIVFRRLAQLGAELGVNRTLSLGCRARSRARPRSSSSVVVLGRRPRARPRPRSSVVVLALVLVLVSRSLDLEDGPPIQSC